jgi:hypothetical protein
MNEVIEEEVSLFDDKQKDDEPIIQAVEDEIVTPAEPTTFDVPKKFQGKSFEDVVEAYTNLEKENGRKANEVGELRKLTDEILRQQVAQPAQADEHINEEIGINDFFDNPAEAVNKALDSNPRLQQLEERLNKENQKTTHQALLNRHSDADDIVASPEFQSWIQESPSRLKMLQESHVNYDVELASDLLNVYKTTKQVSTDEAIAERDAIAAAELKKASSEKGDVTTNVNKVYRRAELIRLKIERPSVYAAMSDEIRKAYAEGRVR